MTPPSGARPGVRPDRVPDAVALARADRFLERVAAFTPAEWGRVAVVGDRLSARDPLSRFEQARRGSAVLADMGLWGRALGTAIGLTTAVTIDLVEMVRRDGAAALMRRLLPPRRRTPADEARIARHARLDALVPRDGDRRSSAIAVLAPALASVTLGVPEDQGLHAVFYAPAEPFIPFASLAEPR